MYEGRVWLKEQNATSVIEGGLTPSQWQALVFSTSKEVSPPLQYTGGVNPPQHRKALGRVNPPQQR